MNNYSKYKDTLKILEMKTFKLEQHPHSFKYHPDWEDVLSVVMPEYTNRVRWLMSEDPNVVETLSSVFNVFKHSFKNKKVLLVFPEPFRDQHAGLPATCSNIATDSSLLSFVKKLADHIKRPVPHGYYPLESSDVFTWCATLTRGGKEHRQFWKDFTSIILNHLQSYISIYVFVGNCGINPRQDLSLKRVTCIQTEPLFSKDEKWSGNSNKAFEIIDAIYSFKSTEAQGIKWEEGFR